MTRILAHHGVAPRVDARYAFQNLCSVRTFERFLRSRPTFVTLPEALAGRGEALTLDDTTHAAGDAARLARARGHAVTLFVNPGQVESGEPYAFVLLYAVLDALDGVPRDFEGRRFETTTRAQREVLRRAVKTRLQSMPDERARGELVRALAAQWRIDHLDVPPHFQTLRKQDLVALRDAGVDVQNHGWSHTDHGSLSVEASDREVREGRAWLSRELDMDARYFAVPFGVSLPLPGATDGCDAWFTLADLGPGPYPAKVVNRVAPNLPDGIAFSRSRRRVRRWVARLRALAGRAGSRR